MNIEPTEPYIYQPFGMQNKAHWEEKKIYGIGGAGLTLVHGVTREQAEKILAIITGKDKDYLAALAEKDRQLNCTVCGGTGKPLSNRECVCGGTGKIVDAYQYVTLELAKRDLELEEVIRAMDKSIGILRDELAQKDEKFIEERQHAKWLQRQIDEDVTIICTRNAEIAKKDKEIALWKKSFRAADKDNEELREENAALIADIEELKSFVRDITLELQDHRKKIPTQMDMLFQKAYTLYAKYDVENRKAIKTVEK